MRSFITLLFLSGSAVAVADIPRTDAGHPDFSGIWQTLSAADSGLEAHASRPGAPPSPGIVDGGFIPYTDAALAQRERNFSAREITLLLRREAVRLQEFLASDQSLLVLRRTSLTR